MRNAIDVYNAFMRGEPSSDALAETLDPQIEWHWHGERTYPDTPQDLGGVPASIEFFEQWRGAWVDVVAEPLELIDAPDDRVLGLIRLRGRGRESDVPIVFHYFEVWTLRDGRMRKFEFFRHRATPSKPPGCGGNQKYRLGREDTSWAMSEENVQIIRQSFDAFERDGIEGSLRYMPPEIEWTTTAGYIEPATYRGHEGIRRYLGTVADEFDDLRVEPQELIDAGDQVVVSVRISGRGKSSGAPVDLTLVSVSLLRDGKIVRTRNYPTKAEALEAAGLSE